MLTRLKVNGFKNLVDVDVQLGPFTCIAGQNGVGKSNLFDAIRFLSALADNTLIDAALSIRDQGKKTTGIRSLFHRHENEYVDEMSFEVEMIVPRTGEDDLGQAAEASITFLRYSLIIAYRDLDESVSSSSGMLEIKKEELDRIKITEAKKKLLFEHKDEWRKSVIVGKKTTQFISTSGDGNIKLHQDGSGGRPRSVLAQNLPRTVLSAANAAESPTALLARREMQSWMLLHLEPSALRSPDSFISPTTLDSDGSHLAATMYRLARSDNPTGNNKGANSQVYTVLANRLAELNEDVYDLHIEKDEKRELYTVMVEDKNRTSHPARNLSDGTLRFLALCVMEIDPDFDGLICLDQPENGIHPGRIPAMLKLLQDIAVDPQAPVDEDNPFRQVIINTHSPSVVMNVPDDSLLVARERERLKNGKRLKAVEFAYLPLTWRNYETREEHPLIPRATLMDYLNPGGGEEETSEVNAEGEEEQGNFVPQKNKRVKDRSDLEPLLPWRASI